MRSPYLEKRVKGVTEIKEIIEGADKSSPGKSRTKSLNREFMIKWLRDNRILELLLVGDSIHPELVKRSTDLAVFLCKNNVFPSNYELNILIS